MFIINLILALLPFLLIIYIYKKDNNISKVNKFILLFIWLFFFPNTIYFLTDFIHLSRDWFYIDDVRNYLISYKDWLSYFHILIGALISLALGLVSLRIFEKVIIRIIKVNFNIILIIVSLLTGLAIYLGRFLRFNSWDVIFFYKIIYRFFDTFSLFSLFFIIMFASITYFAYYIFVNILKTKDL